MHHLLYRLLTLVISLGLPMMLSTAQEKPRSSKSTPVKTTSNQKASPTPSVGDMLYWIREDGKYGYIDNTGNMVIPPQFEDAEDFSEGLAAVKIGNLYGYIDRTGKLVIPAQFSHTHRFMGGVAQVVINKRTGYIDRTGRVLWLQKDSPKEDHESEHHHKH